MKILNNILKHKVEILLMVVLIVSAVVFIINTKENGTKGIENVAEEHQRATLLQEDEEDIEDKLYGKYRQISDEVFLKYFTGQIGDEICVVDKIIHKYQGWSPDKNERGEIIYTKTRKRVNGVTFQDECEGETLEEGWTFCLIDITEFNDYPEERILYYRGMIAEWDFENQPYSDRKSGYQIYKLIADDGVEKYNPENMGSEEKPSVVFVPMGDKGFGFSVKPGESITYKAVIKVPKDYINSNVVFFERLNRKYASNSDFAIKLFSEQEER